MESRGISYEMEILPSEYFDEVFVEIIEILKPGKYKDSLPIGVQFGPYGNEALASKALDAVLDEHSITGKDGADETKTILFVGRRWRDRINGNTYNTCEMFVNGRRVGKTPIDGGYDDAYRWAGRAWLNENGFLPGYDAAVDFTIYCGMRDIIYDSTVSDVRRKKDM